ncbi:MAG TPA: antirestriction protein ArdA [Mycobacteriales bacterium]|nr:antirestriction protein ArdA [Mycobacteriales bacterium]
MSEREPGARNNPGGESGTPAGEASGDPTNPPEDIDEQEALRDPPQIWVGSLTDYNDGRLYGAWIRADQEPDELRAAIAGMLAGSPWLAETGEPAEEWGIFDFDGFGSFPVDEFEDLDIVATVARGIAEHGPAFAAWADLHDGDLDMLVGFDDAYLGEYDSPEAWARETLGETALEAELDRLVPEGLRPYVVIDYAGFARDAEIGGDIHVEHRPGGVWIFAML